MNKIPLILSVFMFLFSCKYFNKNSDSNIKFPDNIRVITVNPEIFIARLPSEVDESSGLIYFNGLLWTFNDSGGLNVLYGINYSGELVKQIEIKNAINIDWEEIAQDKDFIYVGDFGNNFGIRKDLKIYSIKKSEINNENYQTLTAEEIQFSYEDQQDFTFQPQITHYDCEAMVGFNDSLFLFTKNWEEQITSVYKLPEKKGEFNISPVEKFNVNCLVTGADISPDKNKLVLIGYHDFKPVVWIFSGISANNFFRGEKTFIDLNNIYGAQTEGICFLNDNILLISCEINGTTYCKS